MDTFWITFGNDFGEGYKPDFRIHFNKPEQDEGYQCIKVCSYEVVEKLEAENARYREALTIYSEPYFYELQNQGYRNCLDDLGKIALEALKEIE